MSRLALALAVLAAPAFADGPALDAPSPCVPEARFMADVRAVDPGVSRSTLDRLVLDLRAYCSGRMPLSAMLGMPDDALLVATFSPPRWAPVPSGGSASPVPVPPALPLLAGALGALWLARRTA